MTSAVQMVEHWRGTFLESAHFGHAVVCDPDGEIAQAWGDPDLLVLPRSSSKMIQALPLVESGAAQRFNLEDRHLALACASHQGAPEHVELVQAWLEYLGYGDDDLCCGPQTTRDTELNLTMLKSDAPTCRWHNNCSGKHSGFLTLVRHLGAGPNYVDPSHPVQLAVREAWERMTGETVAGFGIDGCSAPNFATTLQGVARAMSKFACADSQTPQGHLTRAMMAHPNLVAGKGRACTALMRAGEGRFAVKTGAEGFFVAIIPETGQGVALKIVDGATRASECAMAAILVKLGVLAADHPTALAYTNAPINNWDGLQTGWQRAAPALC